MTAEGGAAGTSSSRSRAHTVSGVAGSVVVAPTWRGLILLLAALVPVGMAVRFHVLLLPGLGLAVAAYVVVAVDRSRAPGARRLRVCRDHPAIFPVGRGAEVAVTVELVGWARAPVPALLRDEHPPEARASSGTQAVTLRPGAPQTLMYTLVAPARGTRSFGDVVVRAEGPLRLASRQTSVATGEDRLLVDPDLGSVQAYDALVRRGQLAELGVRSVRRHGEGTEFERVRDAVPEDSLRAINWRATARTGRLMASELIPERSQPVIVCIDHGRLMGVGAGALTKLDHALAAALLLAHVALRGGDRVGLVAFGAGISASVAPRAGRVQLGALLQAVRPLHPLETDADFDELDQHLLRTQRRRALVVIFTDVLDPDQGRSLVASTARLRRRHLPLVVTVRDPALDDAARRRPETSEDAYARAVASGLLSDRDATLRQLRLGGIDTLDADARRLSPRLVNRYLEVKRRARL